MSPSSTSSWLLSLMPPKSRARKYSDLAARITCNRLAAQEQYLDWTLWAGILLFSTTSTTSLYSSLTYSFPIWSLKKALLGGEIRSAW